MAPAILSAVSPLMAALPKLVPFVTRAVRRHPTQAIVGLVGLGLLALQLRRSRNRNSHEPPLLR